ncbi:MAG TPA: glycosyltransferase family 1 protein [Acidimicrobiales bacterium]|nr:glycosyltransferase family 1 protein [Acidimicrobiales bacterium]
MTQKPPARLAFNALALQPEGSGVQTYVRELLRSLSVELDAHLVAAVRSDATDQLPAIVEARVRPPARGVRRFLEGARSIGPADLVHGLDASVPIQRKVPMVVTVHDLAVYDVPWAFRRSWVLGTRAVMAHAMRRADEVIAVSEFTAERARSRFGRSAKVIAEAPSASLGPPGDAEIEEVRGRYGLPRQFVLYVGTVEPRKDVATLSRACRELEVPLAIAGRVGHLFQIPLGAQALGYVPETDLAALYGAATAVAYPSVYEGFGLPPLEAMACGAPVVAYSIPPIREVVGDAALLTAPHDEQQLASALRSLLFDEDLRSALSEAGLARSAELTWDAAAAATANVYRSIGITC